MVGYRAGAYLDEGRGSETCFAGLVPEDIYCLPSAVDGAIVTARIVAGILTIVRIGSILLGECFKALVTLRN